MHIPENYLSPSTCAALTAVMLPAWYISVQRVRKEITPERLPLIGIGAAFAFLGMMFNIPLPGGTTGHAVGGTLLAILLGPFAACLSVSTALFIQALFFGDGGILAFGANCFNMALVMPFSGYAVYCLVKKFANEYIAAALGAYVGINLAALCAAIEFGIQPLLFTNGAGQALYCPYPLSISIPAMMLGHLTLFGLAEVVFTTALLGYLRKTAPQLIRGNASDDNSSEAMTSSQPKSVYALLALLITATPLGLLATGTAWGEWDPEEIAGLTEGGSPLGYTPSGMADGFSLPTLFPDYSVAGLPEVFGYILAAIIGSALLIITFRLWAASNKRKVNFN